MMNSAFSSKERGQWVLRRYQAVGLILGGVLLGSVVLFSRDSDFFSTQPPTPFRLALTFDDGPHPAYTERILRVLREQRVAATFFVVGKQAERYPSLVRDLARRGHELANHTYGHFNMTTLSRERVLQELERTRQIVERTAHVKTWFFRPPGGQYNQDTVEIASQEGYRMVLWTVFPRDHASPAPQEIYDRVMASAKDGGVVLLHSGVETTLTILPRLIQDLRKKGFQFLTISEMLAEGIDPRIVSSWFWPKTRVPFLAENQKGLPAEGHRRFSEKPDRS